MSFYPTSPTSLSSFKPTTLSCIEEEPVVSKIEAPLTYRKVTINAEINQPNADLIFRNTIVKAAIIGKTVIVNRGQVSNIEATNNIKIKACLAGNLKSNTGGVKATNCKKIGGISAKTTVVMRDCPEVCSVWTEGGVDLENTNVNYSVQAKGHMKLINSKMRDLHYTVIPGMPSPIIQNCFIGTLYIKRSNKITRDPNNPFVVSPKDSNIFDIRLIDCQVNKASFEARMEEELILVGSSKVNQVIGGNVRLESVEEDSEG